MAEINPPILIFYKSSILKLKIHEKFSDFRLIFAAIPVIKSLINTQRQSE